MKKILSFVLPFVLLSTGCTDSRLEKDRADRQRYLDMERQQQEQEAAAQKQAEEEAQRKANENAASTVDSKVEVRIKASGATMMFDVTRISVVPGATVHVVFENAKPGMLAHNWVLVTPGSEAAVAAAGLNAGEAKGYLDPGGEHVLAHTDLVPPGKTSEVTFTAPKISGSYPYICTFPGHYMMMKGTLEVR